MGKGGLKVAQHVSMMYVMKLKTNSSRAKDIKKQLLNAVLLFFVRSCVISPFLESASANSPKQCSAQLGVLARSVLGRYELHLLESKVWCMPPGY